MDTTNLAEEYMQTMRSFPSALHIATTKGAAGIRGITISACCSLSYKPPTLIFCLSKTRPNNEIFLKNQVFCLNTLGENHRDLADIFGGRTNASQEDRFKAAAWTELVTGSPALEDCYIAFDCRIANSHEYATHNVIIGEVVAIRSHNQTQSPSPLVYHQKTYNSL